MNVCPANSRQTGIFDPPTEKSEKMDLLIDVIIWVVKQFAESGKGASKSPPPVASGMRGRQPIRVGGPPPIPRTPQARAASTARAVRPAKGSEAPAKWLPQPERAPVAKVTAPPAPDPAPRKIARLTALRTPMVLNEVLGPPLALREPEL